MENAFILNPYIAQSLAGEALNIAILKIVKSSTWSLDRVSLELSVRGPGCDHHRVDRELPSILERFDNGHAAKAPLFYATNAAQFDLCLEDFWTGLFVARELGGWPRDEPMIFVHLDDHTDMMPTLLEYRGHGLIDPLSGLPFDPAVPDDWLGAIGSGAITIGSYLTALYHLERPVHVRHLNHFATSRYGRFGVCAREVRFPLLGQRRFAAIGKTRHDGPGALGSYLGGPDPHKVLTDLPAGRLVVHVDLDYFMNDFNGNVDNEADPEPAQQREQAALRLERFFDALRSSGRPVERWIIATSPGFCAARHWDWLLDQLAAAIAGSASAARWAQ